ncbi:hypothetical protein D3C72_773390 [compost metagenome]
MAHLPDARANLAAVGVAKAIAVFFESPIIMLLHASNVLSATWASRRALWRFMLLAIGGLTLALVLFTLPPVFLWIGTRVFGLDPAIAARGQVVLALMAIWPAAIGWRRYFQGQLIRHGHGGEVGRASVARLALVAAVAAFGLWLQVPGMWLAGGALALGVLAEAALVTLAARRLGVATMPDVPSTQPLPTDVGGVWRFYWPLANSMLVVWGGRAVLVAIVARAVDGPIALAAWPAAWGMVLLVANATRMVQQVIIRNRGQASDSLLLRFALSVGLGCSAWLLLTATTPVGAWVLAAFVGNDPALLAGVTPVVLVCAAVPLAVALQNAIQGFLIGEGRTGQVNMATWLGTSAMLGAAALAVAAGWPGALAAAAAMGLALLVELGMLGWSLRAPSPQRQPAA